MVSLGLYYERGLLNPFIDYDTRPWLNMLVDPMGDEGNVQLSPDRMHGIVYPFPSHHRLAVVRRPRRPRIVGHRRRRLALPEVDPEQRRIAAILRGRAAAHDFMVAQGGP
jgi:hypothetical protein